jgi:hypothetical protein
MRRPKARQPFRELLGWSVAWSRLVLLVVVEMRKSKGSATRGLRGPSVSVSAPFPVMAAPVAVVDHLAFSSIK